MGEDGYKYIHKHMDTLPMFLNWEIDIVLAFISSFYVGILLSSSFFNLIAFLGVGVGLSYAYAKFKAASIRGYLSHVMYSFDFKTPKTLVPSYKKHFVGC